jgi:hypothetical protein
VADLLSTAGVGLDSPAEPILGEAHYDLILGATEDPWGGPLRYLYPECDWVSPHFFEILHLFYTLVEVVEFICCDLLGVGVVEGCVVLVTPGVEVVYDLAARQQAPQPIRCGVCGSGTDLIKYTELTLHVLMREQEIKSHSSMSTHLCLRCTIRNANASNQSQRDHSNPITRF